jgi:hypothetical protein
MKLLFVDQRGTGRTHDDTERKRKSNFFYIFNEHETGHRGAPVLSDLADNRVTRNVSKLLRPRRWLPRATKEHI